MTGETEGEAATAFPRGVQEVARMDAGSEGRNAVQRFSYRLFISYVSLNALIVLVAYTLLPLSRPVREVLAIIDGLTTFSHNSSPATTRCATSSGRAAGSTSSAACRFIRGSDSCASCAASAFGAASP